MEDNCKKACGLCASINYKPSDLAPVSDFLGEHVKALEKKLSSGGGSKAASDSAEPVMVCFELAFDPILNLQQSEPHFHRTGRGGSVNATFVSSARHGFSITTSPG